MRTFDIDYVNRIINHPDVIKWVAPKGVDFLDAAPFIEDEKNIALKFEGGCFLLHYLEDGIYEVHTQTLKKGKNVFKAVRDATRYMFLETACMEILTKVPDGNNAAKGLSIFAGFKKEFYRPNVWMYHDGTKVGITYYALRYHDWVKNEKWLDQFGEWFHDKLGEHKNHDEDEAHNRYVGAAVQMVRGGQIDKAIILYNRWAKFSGYMPVYIVSREPIIIDMGTQKLKIKDGDFKICQ